MADVIGTALIRILPDMSRFAPALGSGLANATGITGKLARGLDSVAASAGRVAHATRGITLGVGLIGAAGFKTAMDFESAMKEVQAVTGSTGEEFQRLEDAAIAAGKSGLFSARESALGLSELARAGMTTNESIAALNPVLKLAAAANMQVADTAKVAVTQLNVFGLQAVDTARVADAIAEADFRSITSMEELSNALAYAGPVAEKAGLSFEETAASLAMMANAGFRGSMGGTALRAIFSRLLAPSEKASKILEGYGIKVTDASNNMLPLVDIMKQFEKANISAGDAMTIFGQRGGPGFLGFLKQGDEALTELTKEVQLAGGEVETMSKKFDLSAAGTKTFKAAFLDTFASVDNMKYNLNETAVLLGEYVDSGMNAKEASAQLNKTLGALNSDGFAKMIGATRDADGRLVDSEGNVLSLAQRFAELQSAAAHGADGIDKLSLSQADLTMMTDEGIQKMLEYTKANENSGRVSDVAAIKMDSMQGALKRLRGALEAAAIIFFDSGFLSFFAGMADALAEFVNKINQINPQILKFAGIAAVLLASISPLAYMVQFFAGSLASLLGFVSALLSPVGVLAATIGGLVGYFVLMYQNSERLQTSLGFLFRVVGWAVGQIKDMVIGSSDAGKAMEGFADKAGKVGDTFAGWIDSITAAIPGLIDNVSGFLSIMKEGFLDAIPVVMEFVKGALGGLVIAFKIAEPFIVAAAAAIGSVLIVLSKLMSFLSEHLGLVKALGTIFGVYMVAQLGLFSGAFTAMGGAVQTRLVAMGASVDQFGARMQSGMLGGIPAIGRLGAAVQNFGIRLQLGLGEQITNGFKTSLAAVGAFAAGTFAGMADDAISSLTAISGVAMSVFQGWAAGGPVGAAIAAGAGLIGYFFGRAKKDAQEAAAANKEVRDSIHEISVAMNDAGISKWSTDQQKAKFATEQLLATMKGGGKEAEYLQSAFRNFGFSFEDLAKAASQGSDGVKSMNDQIKLMTTFQADQIANQAARGMSNFGAFTDEASIALSRLNGELSLAITGDYSKAYEFDASGQSANLKDLTSAWQDYVDASGNSASVLGDSADAQERVNEMQDRFAVLLQRNLADSPVAQFLADMPKKYQKAIDEQMALNELQKAVQREQEINRSGVEKFNTAFSATSEVVSAATTAYGNWLDVLSGAAPDMAEAQLNIAGIFKQISDVQKGDEDERIKSLERIKLINDAMAASAPVMGQFLVDSAGNFDTFRTSVVQFSGELVETLVASLGVSREEATRLVQEIIKIPDEAVFRVISDVNPAVTSLDELRSNISKLILRDPTLTMKLNDMEPTEKFKKINEMVNLWAQQNPEAAAKLGINDVKNKEKMVQEIIASLSKQHATPSVTMTFDAVVSQRMKDAVATLERMHKAGVDPRNLYIPGGYGQGTGGLPAGADGGIFTAPTAMLIGEAGPEVLIPLSDPARAAELAGKSGLLDVLSSSTVPAQGAESLSIPSLAVGVSGEDVTGPVETGFESLAPSAIAALQTFGETVWAAVGPTFLFLQQNMILTFKTVLDYIVAFPVQAWTLMLPGLISFSANLLANFQATSSSVQSVFAQMTNAVIATFQSMLATLASSSTTGGASIVSALSTALSAGTTAVARIVSGYALSLANSLNPILRAIGEKDIDVKKFAKGGVNDPRIVPDGAYDVHVFGESGTHGEAYIPFNPSNRKRSRAIAEETVARLGGSAQWFAGGGVTGNTKGLDPRFLNRLDLWGKALGDMYVVNSGYRSIERQAQMYADYLAGRKKEQTAPPGRSFHNYGLASDGSHWRSRNPGAFGLTFPMGHEPWHVQPVEAAAWRAAMQAGMPMAPDGGFPGLVSIPNAPDAGSKGVVSDVAASLMGAAHDKALAWASSQGGMSGGATMPVLGELPVNIKRILATIMALESGGNYTARNPNSSASGAYQFTNGTWGGYGGYAAAYLAPPSVQDAKAAANVQAILAKYGGALEAVPAAWYTGTYRGPGRLDYNPGGPGNPLSVQEYVNRWLAKYSSIPGFADGAFFNNGATIGVVGEAGPEVLLPMGKPSRALQLAVDSGLMRVLDEERERATVPSRRSRPSDPYDDGLLGGRGNSYTIVGVGLEQVKAEIRARDAAADRGRR